MDERCEPHGGRAEAAVTAEVVLPCPPLDDTIRFFCERLGFRLDAISPADDPAVAVVSGHGLRLRLEREAAGAPGTIRLLCHDPSRLAGDERALTAPNGTRVVVADLVPPLVVPPNRPCLVVSQMGDEARWGTGRAGMRYRDLVPDRQGGRFVASHIRIPDGGPVPDYVHHHRVRFQMIYCRRGWVRVVYEDQGPPFELRAGDCVLQPPGIRHRVLEASPGLEVVEIACPARHDTFVDHDLTLPTPALRPDRDFGGQRFVRHQAASSSWQPWRIDGFECRDSGIGAATDGLAGVRVVRLRDEPASPSLTHDGELLFLFVLEGALGLEAEPGFVALSSGDSAVVPPGMPHALVPCAAELEVLEVTLPADLPVTGAPT